MKFKLRTQISLQISILNSLLNFVFQQNVWATEVIQAPHHQLKKRVKENLDLHQEILSTEEIPETEIAKAEVARQEMVVKNVAIQLLHRLTHPNRTSHQVDIIDAVVEAFLNLQEITESDDIIIRFQIMIQNFWRINLLLIPKEIQIQWTLCIKCMYSKALEYYHRVFHKLRLHIFTDFWPPTHLLIFAIFIL